MVRNFKRLLLALFVVLVAITTLFFVLENQSRVALVLFGWSMPDVPLAVVVMLAFGVGLSIGPLLGFLLAKRIGRRDRQVA